MLQKLEDQRKGLKENSHAFLLLHRLHLCPQHLMLHQQLQDIQLNLILQNYQHK
jgi:hypothetical protein